MKKKSILIIILTFLCFYSCESEHPLSESNEILEFSFLADNNDSLEIDYFGDINDNEISITLPFDVTIENLVANFKTNGENIKILKITIKLIF